MRHRKKINHLGRKSPHRKAMLSNMASSLIMNKRIFTTLAKAKALRVYVEPLITKSKEDSTHSRRTVFSYLQDKQAVSELFREVSQKIADRPGGYTRILKTGFRKGDAAEMCFIELVDYNTNMLKTAEDETKKTRRSRRGKKSSDTTAEKPAAAPVAEETTPEQPETEVKKEVKAEAPAEETTEAPAEESTEAPAEESTEAPAEETPEASKEEKEEEDKKKEE